MQTEVSDRLAGVIIYMKGVEITKGQVNLDSTLMDKLKSVGVNLTWKILLDLDLFRPFRIANRSLEDILYPKETYSSKRPLPILQKTRDNRISILDTEENNTSTESRCRREEQRCVFQFGNTYIYMYIYIG